MTHWRRRHATYQDQPGPSLGTLVLVTVLVMAIVLLALWWLPRIVPGG